MQERTHFQIKMVRYIFLLIGTLAIILGNSAKIILAGVVIIILVFLHLLDIILDHEEI